MARIEKSVLGVTCEIPVVIRAKIDYVADVKVRKKGEMHNE